MNKKIKKYLDEIAKTEKKIADLQQYLRGVQAALKQEEDNEMIRCIRGMKMDRDSARLPEICEYDCRMGKSAALDGVWRDCTGTVYDRD